MNTVNMSFRPNESLKNSLQFIADYEGKSLNSVIISHLEESIERKKDDIKRHLFFHNQALENYKKYQETGEFYTLNEL